MVGLSGSGKTYLADALACRIGAVVLSSDVVRREGMAQPSEDEASVTAYGAGRYGEEARALVYGRMRELARGHLALGHSVILDASHIARGDRDAARELGTEHGVPAIGLEVIVDDEVVRDRIARRTEEGASASEATWEIYAEQKRRMEAVGADEGAIVRVDAGRSVSANVDEVIGRIVT